MRTIEEIIAFVDETKPNAFSKEAKTQWLNEVEGLVQTEIMLFAPEQIITYDYTEDKDKVLLVEPPHNKLYPAYLIAMIDFANGEYNKYANTQAMFNAHYKEFEKWFVTHYKPADNLNGGD